MSQKPIDLMPEAIRASCQAGLRTGRYIAAVVTGIVIVVVLSTHSRVNLERAQDRLEQARRTADMVLQTEARSAELHVQLREAERSVMLHDQIAMPMRISALLSTMVNRLPASVSLDRVDLNASSRTPARSARANSKSSGNDVQPRYLTGELAGFAASDADIIKILESLSSMHPFEDITLDFTRTRTVRSHAAREFRISFRVNLDSAYEERVATHPQLLQPHDGIAVELTHALDESDG